jgi:hypothetical protein
MSGQQGMSNETGGDAGVGAGFKPAVPPRALDLFLK